MLVCNIIIAVVFALLGTSNNLNGLPLRALRSFHNLAQYIENGYMNILVVSRLNSSIYHAVLPFSAITTTPLASSSPLHTPLKVRMDICTSRVAEPTCSITAYRNITSLLGPQLNVSDITPLAIMQIPVDFPFYKAVVYGSVACFGMIILAFVLALLRKPAQTKTYKESTWPTHKVIICIQGGADFNPDWRVRQGLYDAAPVPTTTPLPPSVSPSCAPVDINTSGDSGDMPIIHEKPFVMEWQAPASPDNVFPYISLPPGLDVTVRNSVITGDYYLTIFVPSNSINLSEDARTHDKLVNSVESNIALNNDDLSQLARYGTSSKDHNLSTALASTYASPPPLMHIPMPTYSTPASTFPGHNDQEDDNASQLARYSTPSEDGNIGAAPPFMSIPTLIPMAMTMSSTSISMSSNFDDQADVNSSPQADESDDINSMMTDTESRNNLLQLARYGTSTDRNLGAAPTSVSANMVLSDAADNSEDNDTSLEDPTAPGSSFRLHLALSLVPPPGINENSPEWLAVQYAIIGDDDNPSDEDVAQIPPPVDGEVDIQISTVPEATNPPTIQIVHVNILASDALVSDACETPQDCQLDEDTQILPRLEIAHHDKISQSETPGPSSPMATAPILDLSEHIQAPCADDSLVLVEDLEEHAISDGESNDAQSSSIDKRKGCMADLEDAECVDFMVEDQASGKGHASDEREDIRSNHDTDTNSGDDSDDDDIRTTDHLSTSNADSPQETRGHRKHRKRRENMKLYGIHAPARHSEAGGHRKRYRRKMRLAADAHNDQQAESSGMAMANAFSRSSPAPDMQPTAMHAESSSGSAEHIVSAPRRFTFTRAAGRALSDSMSHSSQFSGEQHETEVSTDGSQRRGGYRPNRGRGQSYTRPRGARRL